MTCASGQAVYALNGSGTASCRKNAYTTTESDARYARKITCTTVSSARKTGSGAAQALCASGYTMTGGGMINHYRSAFNAIVAFEESRPVGNGWYCDNGLGNGDFTCYARCCRFY